MNSDHELIYCRNCGVAIDWLPLIENGCIYCCRDCMSNFSCECTPLDEPEEERLSNRGSVVSLIASYSS